VEVTILEKRLVLESKVRSKKIVAQISGTNKILSGKNNQRNILFLQSFPIMGFMIKTIDIGEGFTAFPDFFITTVWPIYKWQILSICKTQIIGFAEFF